MNEAANGWNLLKYEKIRNPPTAISGFVYVVIFIISLFMLAVLFFSLYKLATLLVGSNPEDAAEAAKNLILAIGAVVAAPFVVWRTWIIHQQWRNGVKQVDIQGETLNTSLITKAIEMIGAMSEKNISKKGEDGSLIYVNINEINLESRIGGILILKRMARSSKQDLNMIVEVLKEYIKSNTKDDYNEIEEAIDRDVRMEEVFEPEYYKRSSPDVDACVRALVEIVATCEYRGLVELDNSVISGVDLTNRKITGIDFSNCYLVNVRFNDSVIFDVLMSARKMYDCFFYGTDLSRSTIFSSGKSRFSYFDEKTKIPSGFTVKVSKSTFGHDFSPAEYRYFSKDEEPSSH